MRSRLHRLALCAVTACALWGQDWPHLKTARAPEAVPTGAESEALAPARSWFTDRRHVLAEFEEQITSDQINELRQKGVRFVQYVPDNGFVLSVGQDFRVDGSGLRRADRVRVEQKLSPALHDESIMEGREHLLVEFYPDVDPRVGRIIAGSVGFEVLEHAALLPSHLLLRGRPENAGILAEWDEVAYVFPASLDLAEGEHVRACPGALTYAGTVGQYVATVGDGWDGPGRGSAELGYHFQQLTQKLPEDDARAELARALGEWARAASLTFTEAQSGSAARTLNFLFAKGDHGDGYPFDGWGHVLGHTFYPSPPNPEPIAGDVHLDDDEEWVIGPDLSLRSVDLFSVSLHEVGHALGLGHSDVPGSVMYPYYRRATALTQEDANAILRLYAAPGEAPDPEPPPTAPLALVITDPAVFPVTTEAASLPVSGVVTGGTGNILVIWTSDRTGAGVAQGGRGWNIPSLPLQLGSNRITITATDTAAGEASGSVVVTRQAVAERPAITIASPTTGSSYVSRSPTITLAGAASPASGIVRVEWTSSRGASGLASGTSAWSSGPIPLQPGENLLTVTARDGRGVSASSSLQVTYSAANDTVAPVLRITLPASTSVLVTSASIRIQGTATDNVAVAVVTWLTSFNKSGVATGTSFWNTGDVPLLVGTNVIVVRGYDAAGNSSWRSLTVTRR